MQKYQFKLAVNKHNYVFPKSQFAKSRCWWDLLRSECEQICLKIMFLFKIWRLLQIWRLLPSGVFGKITKFSENHFRNYEISRASQRLQTSKKSQKCSFKSAVNKHKLDSSKITINQIALLVRPLNPKICKISCFLKKH